MRRSLAQEPTLARIRALGVLADHREAVTVGKGERAQVHVEVKFEPSLQQQATLNDARWHIGSANCSEQNRIVGTQLGKSLVIKHGAVTQVALASKVELGRGDVGAGCGNHSERNRDDLRSDAVSADDCNAMSHFDAPC